MVTGARKGKWKRRIILLVGLALVLLVIVYLVVQIDFRRWRRRLYVDLQSGSKLADTDWGAIEYIALGEGPAVLIMHGAPGGYDQAMPVPGFLVVAPSRPGYLQTKLSVGATHQEQAEACAALLDSLGIERVAVLGFSSGGPPALHFAAEYPDRTWALVLVSAVTKQWIGPVPKASAFQRVTDWVFGTDFADWLMARAVTLFPEQLLIGQENEFLSAEDREILRKDPAKLRFLADIVANKIGPWSLRREGSVNDTMEHARMGQHDPLPISTPALVIHGTADAAVDLSHAESAAGRIPGSELVKIANAGHAVWFAHYKDIESMVVRFLHKHAPNESSQ